MSDWRVLHSVALAVGVILCAGATAVCLYVWPHYVLGTDGIVRKDVEDLLVQAGISRVDALALVDPILDMSVHGGSSVETAANAMALSVNQFNIVLGEN